LNVCYTDRFAVARLLRSFARGCDRYVAGYVLRCTLSLPLHLLRILRRTFVADLRSALRLARSACVYVRCYLPTFVARCVTFGLLRVYVYAARVRLYHCRYIALPLRIVAPFCGYGYHLPHRSPALRYYTLRIAAAPAFVCLGACRLDQCRTAVRTRTAFATVRLRYRTVPTRSVAARTAGYVRYAHRTVYHVATHCYVLPVTCHGLPLPFTYGCSRSALRSSYRRSHTFARRYRCRCQITCRCRRAVRTVHVLRSFALPFYHHAFVCIALRLLGSAFRLPAVRSFCLRLHHVAVDRLLHVRLRLFTRYHCTFRVLYGAAHTALRYYRVSLPFARYVRCVVLDLVISLPLLTHRYYVPRVRFPCRCCVTVSPLLRISVVAVSFTGRAAAFTPRCTRHCRCIVAYVCVYLLLPHHHAFALRYARYLTPAHLPFCHSYALPHFTFFVCVAVYADRFVAIYALRCLRCLPHTLPAFRIDYVCGLIVALHV